LNLLSFQEIKDLLKIQLTPNMIYIAQSKLETIMDELCKKIMKNECILDDKDKLKEMQIYLIHVYLEYQEDFPVKSEKNISEYLINWSETLSPRKIWNWDDEIEYYKFIIFLVVIFSIICRIGKNSSQLFEILGIISVSFETFIELPQIKENCMTKDIRNLSGEMVFMWFAGDLFKTSYNFIYHSPLQIIIGGIIMNLEDIILSSQVIYFDENNYINKLFQGRPKYVNLDEVKLSESNRIDFDTDKNSSL
jgi:hypothetical protein